jgi:hypothetical protein
VERIAGDAAQAAARQALANADDSARAHELLLHQLRAAGGAPASIASHRGAASAPACAQCRRSLARVAPRIAGTGGRLYCSPACADAAATYAYLALLLRCDFACLPPILRFSATSNCASCGGSLAGVAPIMTDKRARRFCSAQCCDRLNNDNNINNGDNNNVNNNLSTNDNDNNDNNNNNHASGDAKPVPPPARHRDDANDELLTAKMKQIMALQQAKAGAPPPVPAKPAAISGAASTPHQAPLRRLSHDPSAPAPAPRAAGVSRGARALSPRAAAAPADASSATVPRNLGRSKPVVTSWQSAAIPRRSSHTTHADDNDDDDRPLLASPRRK